MIQYIQRIEVRMKVQKVEVFKGYGSFHFSRWGDEFCLSSKVGTNPFSVAARNVETRDERLGRRSKPFRAGCDIRYLVKKKTGRDSDGRER